MVDNRGIGPMPSIGFKSDNASANKMSDEKQGQGGEYFAQNALEEENANKKEENFQDRSAQLRASLNGLAMANAGSIMFMKTLKKKEFEQKVKEKYKEKEKQTQTQTRDEESQEEKEELLEE